MNSTMQIVVTSVFFLIFYPLFLNSQSQAVCIRFLKSLVELVNLSEFSRSIVQDLQKHS